MRSLSACIQKELLEHVRSGKLMIILIVFVMFGIMNPAIAKLTPWLLEALSEELAESGMHVDVMEVSALDSWVQFYKNMPMGLIAFVLLESNVFTREYQSGTIVLSLTKGLARKTVTFSKTLVVLLMWSAGYWICFGITYLYSEFFWDNSSVQNLFFAAVCWWLFGIWTSMLVILFSAPAKTNVTVLIGTGGTVFVCSLLGMITKIKKYIPSLLTDGNSLTFGLAAPEDYICSIIVTIAVCVLCLAINIPILNRKQI